MRFVDRFAPESPEFPAPASSDAQSAREVLTVSQLNRAASAALQASFAMVWVAGEVSNLARPASGHWYFTLKDSSSQLRGFMFRSSLRYLKFKPTDGLCVVARGKISVYEPKGEYQLVCAHLEPQGLGALQLAFDQLKKRLHASGAIPT